MTPAPPAVESSAARVDRLRAEAYAAFRAIVDDYERPALASQAHVVGAAAALARAAGRTLSQDTLDLGAGRAWLGLAEGRTFRCILSPGSVALSAHDAVRRERTMDRLAHNNLASIMALYDDAGGTIASVDAPWLGPDGLLHAGELPQGQPVGPPARVITQWSAKSRARMFTTVAELDLSEWAQAEGALAMVTLTLPGDWLAVAPTGPVFKAQIRAFQERMRRAGLPVIGLWKLEFQHRGAPHVHILMRVPALVAGRSFEAWLAETWAAVVGADDLWCHECAASSCGCEVPDTEFRRHLRAGTAVDLSGSRFSDPRRIATYFLGHSSKHTDGKEYQHVVPEAWRGHGDGPGRFWGYWGLKRGTVAIDLDQREWFAVRRMLRHVARARAWRQTQDAAKYGKTIVRRPLRSLGRNGALTGGSVVVNDGVALGYELARAVAILRT